MNLFGFTAKDGHVVEVRMVEQHHQDHNY